MSADLIHTKPSRGFNLSRWAIGHGSFTAFLLALLLAAGAFLCCASARRGPRLHVPRHGCADAVARRDDRGDAGPGGRQG